GMIDYYLKTAPSGNVRISISDKSGKLVREMMGTKEAGVNRVVWDLRMSPANQGGPGFGGGGGGGRGGGGGGGGRGGAGGGRGGRQQAPQQAPQQAATSEPGAGGSETPPAAAQFGGGGGGGFGGGGRGPRVPPGEYTIKVSTGGKDATGVIRVQEDP